MDKEFFVETEHFANDSNTKISSINQTQITSDNIVNDFLNKNVSLESLIEKELNLLYEK